MAQTLTLDTNAAPATVGINDVNPGPDWWLWNDTTGVSWWVPPGYSAIASPYQPENATTGSLPIDFQYNLQNEQAANAAALVNLYLPPGAGAAPAATAPPAPAVNANNYAIQQTIAQVNSAGSVSAAVAATDGNGNITAVTLTPQNAVPVTVSVSGAADVAAAAAQLSASSTTLAPPITVAAAIAAGTLPGLSSIVPGSSQDIVAPNGGWCALLDPNGNEVKTGSMAQLNNWLYAQYTPLRDDGTPAMVQVFDGGWLIDGNPLNVWLGCGWLPGQQTVLAPFVTAGEVATPTKDLTKVLTPATGPSWLEIGALAAGVWFLFLRKRGS